MILLGGTTCTSLMVLVIGYMQGGKTAEWTDEELARF